jgi:hypothetical protein
MEGAVIVKQKLTIPRQPFPTLTLLIVKGIASLKNAAPCHDRHGWWKCNFCTLVQGCTC